MKRIMKYALISFVILLIAYYISLIVVFNLNIREDYKAQADRIAALRLQPSAAVDESAFVNFDITNNTLRLNEIQVLSTHNSYKTMPNMYISKPLEVLFGDKVRNGQYGMPYLTEQLDNGIRGLEIDITKYGDDFILMHDPKTDWRTNGPDFRLALEEIKIWSDANVNHIPINIMLQVRSSWTMFSHKIGAIEEADLVILNDMLEDVFGRDGIIRPEDVIGDRDNLREAVENDGWPQLSDCMGKVYFAMLFDQKTTEAQYVAIDPSFKIQNSFIFTKIHEMQDYSSIILADSPFADGLNGLIDKNYLLRTRVDVQHNHPIDRLQASITLGSTILATDYPVGNTYTDGYICKLTSDNKTIIARGSVTFG